MDDNTNMQKKHIMQAPSDINGDNNYLGTFGQPVYYQGITQPGPVNTLPLFLQQAQTQQMPQQQHMHQVQPQMPQQQFMQQPQSVPQPPGDTQQHEIRFTDFEQLSMISEGIPITAESIQYLNGFLRTQIGRRVRIEFLIGTNMYIDKEGILLGVGVNYVLINETDTDDITVCDFYNIRFVKIYY